MNFILWFKGFFEDDAGNPSMTRLLCFISIFPSSYVVCVTRSAEVFGWYVSAYVLGYVGGKTAELLGKQRKPSITKVTMNQPDKVNVAS